MLGGDLLRLRDGWCDIVTKSLGSQFGFKSLGDSSNEDDISPARSPEITASDFRDLDYNVAVQPTDLCRGEV